jgi:protein-L-isoaspartate(D-aspartate) O-methyltransferase
VPPALIAQLGEGGRLVVPIAADEVDELTIVRRRGDTVEAEVLGPCRFVPLIGAEGF